MNYNNLAQYGRGGDTELRDVDGQISHVNKGEARAIDLFGKLGEALVKETGSGTANPTTGMPEYFGHKEWWNANIKPIGNMSLPDAAVYIVSGGNIDTSNEEMGNWLNFKDMDSGITGGTIFGAETKRDRGFREDREEQQFYDSMGYDKSKFNYTGGEFDPTSSEFRESLKKYGGFGELLYGYGMDKEDAQFFDKPNMEKLEGIGERWEQGTADMMSETGESIASIKSQGDTQRSKSNMAYSGTVSSMEKQATTSIWKDYSSQQKGLELDLAEGESQFWEDVETRFYDTMLAVETN